MEAEIIQLWPGVEGRILRPNHPDSLYPKLGIEVTKGIQNVSFSPEKLSPLHQAVRKYGVLLFETLTAQQRQELDNNRFYNWSEVPPRRNRTRIPHLDDITGGACTSLFWPQKRLEGVSTGFSGVEPALRSILKHLPLIGEEKPAEEARETLEALGGRYYAGNNLISPRTIEAIRHLRDVLVLEDLRPFFGELYQDLRTIGIEAPWTYELGVYSENILHWGAEGEIKREDIKVTSVIW